MLQASCGVAFAEGSRALARKRDTFAARLAAIRDVADISQYRLAQLSGISKQTISKLELGETAPSWETVQLLAKALGVSCEAFVIEDIQPPEPPPVKRPGRKPRKPRRK
jgi:transcriptional regulator with XRE-family HTH domain